MTQMDRSRSPRIILPFTKKMGYSLILLAYLSGGVSLFLFTVFLFFGPFVRLTPAFNTKLQWIVNILLSFQFFIQHSGMIRKRFRTWIGRYIDDRYQNAIFTIASGLSLLMVILLWQSSSHRLLDISGPIRWFIRFPVVLSFVGFCWGVRSLGAFDFAGIKPIINEIKETPRPSKIQPTLTVRGPYRWVRHPLYLFTLVLFWAYPDLTVDRLFMNILWTVWIVLACFLEEKDLKESFGAEYQAYQKAVPMLLPGSIKPAWK